jgi:hypothetical protein
MRASDGTWLHGYVTLPKSAKAGVPSPLVVLPHGGPHYVRDYWGYDPEVQLLASEGFAVLQVNFRGSGGGYGYGFQEARYGHCGDRVIQDIVDATRLGRAFLKRVLGSDDAAINGSRPRSTRRRSKRRCCSSTASSTAARPSSTPSG